jgi:four helix bundle protein
MRRVFDHENLRVYQESIKFVIWVDQLLERVPANLSSWDQLDRASNSIPLNIAEGNGRVTPPDRCGYFDNARGSALECAASLDVLVARKIIVDAEIIAGKKFLNGIVSMLVGLIRNNSPTRLHEDHTASGTDERYTRIFDHEKLRVYQESLTFIRWLSGVWDRISTMASVRSHLDRASTAIPLNIAEGNGKFTAPDRCRYFDNARSSALRCAASLDLVVAKKVLVASEIDAGKNALQNVVAMLVGLANSHSPGRQETKQINYRAARPSRGKQSDYD